MNGFRLSITTLQASNVIFCSIDLSAVRYNALTMQSHFSVCSSTKGRSGWVRQLQHNQLLIQWLKPITVLSGYRNINKSIKMCSSMAEVTELHQSHSVANLGGARMHLSYSMTHLKRFSISMSTIGTTKAQLQPRTSAMLFNCNTPWAPGPLGLLVLAGTHGGNPVRIIWPNFA